MECFCPKGQRYSTFFCLCNNEHLSKESPEAHFLKSTEGYKLFKGKIADVLRETRNGFNFGKVVLEGIGECRGQNAAIEFQNENLTASVEGEIVATTPDLICLVDTENLTHRRAGDLKRASYGGLGGRFKPDCRRNRCHRRRLGV
ncbi:MAG: DUF917 domain-containing protein [Lachnospiraceae bacterium]